MEKTTPERLREVELFALIGEDEFGSGVIGLKQAQVPAGYIALVATAEEKVSRELIREAMSAQAQTYGKRIYLCRFRFDAVLWNTPEGDPPGSAGPASPPEI